MPAVTLLVLRSISEGGLLTIASVKVSLPRLMRGACRRVKYKVPFFEALENASTKAKL